MPALLLAGLRLSGVSALSAPAAVYLRIHLPWGDGTPVVSPVMSASGLQLAQREALSKLRVELLEEARKAKAAAKADAKADRAKTKGAAPAGKPAKPAAPAAASAAPPTSLTAKPASSAARDDRESVDSDEDDALSGDEAAAAAASAAGAGGVSSAGGSASLIAAMGSGTSYSALDEDAHFAIAAAAAADGGPAASGDAKRRALLALTVDYTWTPAETAIPPLRPAIWDPRLLRTGHVFIVAHAAPGADGSSLAIGGGKPKSGSAAGGTASDAVVGIAVLPLLGLVKAAAAANEVALTMQAEDDGEQIGAAAAVAACVRADAARDSFHTHTHVRPLPPSHCRCRRRRPRRAAQRHALGLARQRRREGRCRACPAAASRAGGDRCEPRHHRRVARPIREGLQPGRRAVGAHG